MSMQRVGGRLVRYAVTLLLVPTHNSVVCGKNRSPVLDNYGQHTLHQRILAPLRSLSPLKTFIYILHDFAIFLLQIHKWRISKQSSAHQGAFCHRTPYEVNPESISYNSDRFLPYLESSLKIETMTITNVEVSMFQILRFIYFCHIFGIFCHVLNELC